VNRKIVVRKCGKYDPDLISDLISEIYESAGGPDPAGKRVLVKPNVLNDTLPEKAICTHFSVVEGIVRYLQSRGAEVVVGDSPSIHFRNFIPVRNGIADVCKRTGVPWIDFRKDTADIQMNRGKIRVAGIVRNCDLIISLPKFKNHELVYITGAVKNTLGLVPGFIKAKQHALYQDRHKFAEFLVDLNEAVLPDFFLLDGIVAMEGPGPANGRPRNTGILAGSVNPLAIDIIQSTIAGYNPMDIPTNIIGLARGKWLASPDEIIYDGPDIDSLIIRDFLKIPVVKGGNISLQFVIRRIRPLRKLEKRPVFIHENCTGCLRCVKICPVNAISPHPVKENHIVLTDSKCIRCYCCSEVCTDNAVEIRRKLFGV